VAALTSNAVRVAEAAAAGPGPTFGSGYAGVQICSGSTVILNHTVGAGSSGAVLHHFWTTGPAVAINRIHVDYYIDQETAPSISFQPALMCGFGFPLNYSEADQYSAGDLCGKSATVGGWWNTFPVPFEKSVLVKARPDAADTVSGCIGGYINVRGTENLQLTLPGGLVPLPSSARLRATNWTIRQPFEFVDVVSLPAGSRGVIFMVSLFVEAQPVGGVAAGGGYIEGCWNLLDGANASYPGLVVGTGVEDYFDSAYYFGADSDVGHAVPFTTPLSDGYERLSAYRFHNRDPLVLTDGGSLTWRVGAKGGPGNSKCGCDLPPTPPASSDAAAAAAAATAVSPLLSSLSSSSSQQHQQQQQAVAAEVTAQGALGRTLSPINVATYGWVYVF
jgi:hypothetical protein